MTNRLTSSAGSVEEWRENHADEGELAGKTVFYLEVR